MTLKEKLTNDGIKKRVEWRMKEQWIDDKRKTEEGIKKGKERKKKIKEGIKNEKGEKKMVEVKI